MAPKVASPAPDAVLVHWMGMCHVIPVQFVTPQHWHLSPLPLPGLWCLLHQPHSCEQWLLWHRGDIPLLLLPGAKGRGCGTRGKGDPGDQQCSTACPAGRTRKFGRVWGTVQGNAAALVCPQAKLLGQLAPGPNQYEDPPVGLVASADGSCSLEGGGQQRNGTHTLGRPLYGL